MFLTAIHVFLAHIIHVFLTLYTSVFDRFIHRRLGSYTGVFDHFIHRFLAMIHRFLTVQYSKISVRSEQDPIPRPYAWVPHVPPSAPASAFDVHVRDFLSPCTFCVRRIWRMFVLVRSWLMMLPCAMIMTWGHDMSVQRVLYSRTCVQFSET